MAAAASSLVVGATIEKKFPGYGVHRGTVAEIDGGKVLVHWATDERTTLSLTEAAKRVIAIPSDVDDDDQSVTSAAFGIESSATSFTAPRHVLLELDDDGDALTTSSRFWGALGIGGPRSGWRTTKMRTQAAQRRLLRRRRASGGAVNMAIRDAGPKASAA